MMKTIAYLCPKGYNVTNEKDTDCLYMAWPDKINEMGGLYFKYEDAVKSLGFDAKDLKVILKEGMPVDCIDISKDVTSVKIYGDDFHDENHKTDTLYLATYIDEDEAVYVLGAFVSVEGAADCLKQYFKLPKASHQALLTDGTASKAYKRAGTVVCKIVSYKSDDIK